MPHRIAITSSAPGSGKSTLGRAVAERLNVPYIEADTLAWSSDGVETPTDVLRARLAAVVASDSWVIDGVYRGKVGDLVLAAADTVVWIDLPIRTWLPRVVRRSLRGGHSPRLLARSVREALHGHGSRRRRYPELFAKLPLVRLRTQAAVDQWLAELR